MLLPIVCTVIIVDQLTEELALVRVVSLLQVLNAGNHARVELGRFQRQVELDLTADLDAKSTLLHSRGELDVVTGNACMGCATSDMNRCP